MGSKSIKTVCFLGKELLSFMIINRKTHQSFMRIYLITHLTFLTYEIFSRL